MELDLAAALGSNSKKTEGASQVGEPKPSSLKAQGRLAADTAHKPGHGRSSSSNSSSSSSSDSEAEGKPPGVACKQHKCPPNKTKKPKVKKEKKKGGKAPQ